MLADRLAAARSGVLRHRRAWILANLAVALTYGLVGYVGDRYGLILFGNLTAFWPSSGIALAAVIFLGPGVWPGILLGSFASNALAFFDASDPHAVARSLAVNLMIGLGSALQALLGGAVLRRVCKDRDPLDRASDVIKFIGWVGIVCSGVSALIGTLSLAVGGFVGWSAFFGFAWTWWLGETTGVLVVTPFLLVWLGKRLRDSISGSLREAALLGALLIAATSIVFGPHGQHEALTHLVLPFLVWATLRFGSHGAVTTITFIYLAAMQGSAHGWGPFIDPEPHHALLMLQLFLGDATLTTLTLAALLTQRKNAEASLRVAHGELEHRVEARTLELSEANARLSRERNFSGAVLDTAGALVVVLDREGRIVRFNHTSEALTGHAQEEVLGATFWDLFGHPGQSPEASGSERAGPEPVLPPGRYETTWQMGSAPARTIAWTETVLHDAAGQIEFVILSGSDVTLRSEQLRQVQEAVEARDDFLSIASHELKTPLTSLQLSMQAVSGQLRKGSSTPLPAPVLAGILDRSEKQMKRLTGLINNLLDVSRLQAGRLELEREPVELGGLIREVVSQLADDLARSGTPLEVHAEQAVSGLWDPARLEQVVTNLLTNAIKYGDGKPVVVSLRAEGELALLRIADRGIGIAPEMQERIFDRFERAVSSRHYGGLGLGLYIVRQIVEAHGGRVSLESGLGEGAVFTVELPLEPRKPARIGLDLGGTLS